MGRFGTFQFSDPEAEAALAEFVVNAWAVSVTEEFQRIETLAELRLLMIRDFRRGSRNRSVLAEASGVSSTTLRRFLDDGRVTQPGTIRSILRVLSASLHRGDSASDAIASVDTEPLSERPASLERLRQLESALESLVPASTFVPGSNRQPIPLRPDDFELLVATVRSAISFHDVQRWDDRVKRVIRALTEIMLEIEKLLDVSANLAIKQLKKLLKGVASGLRMIADAADVDRDR